MTPQTPQISRDPSISSHENVFGSYRPQHFENAPNFTSSPVEGQTTARAGGPWFATATPSQPAQKIG
ncbi:hypothetical protein MTR67_037847 [Solanum verrucosum]|uniref:Uncharacterized protein n=1 Tax=Solanum verrucosum TaxID=315347 RepID=A0AAF0ZMA6_SOLVR|nr:hypothetical protein MTR67_037847 [Solanum verrucosum]